MPGTIVLGIDVETASEDARGYTQYGTELYHQLDIPVTYYVTGRTLELYPEVFAALEKDTLIDLQCHTYNHLCLKTVYMDLPPRVTGHDDKPYFVMQGGSSEEIDEDMTRCSKLFQDILGRKPRGLTGPWCYYRGLQDRPDILSLLHRHGIRYLRTFGRDARDCQPVPIEWQPFMYASQGFSDMLEIFIHDYQDDFYWRMFALPGPNDTYETHLRMMADRVASKDLVWSAASHDHGCATRQGFEMKGKWLRSFIRYAKELEIRFLNAEQYYQEVMNAKQTQ